MTNLENWYFTRSSRSRGPHGQETHGGPIDAAVATSQRRTRTGSEVGEKPARSVHPLKVSGDRVQVRAGLIAQV
jgi:hypothetical protein